MTVLYPHQVAGKTAVSAVDANGVLHSGWLSNFFSNYFNDLIEKYSDWPLDAVFKLEVKYHTWPCGWEREFHTSFFTTFEEVEARLAELKDWALCEDNQVHIKVWEWDLGPDLKEEIRYW